MGMPYSKEKNLKNSAEEHSSSKLGHDFINKVVQKLTKKKKCFNKRWSPKLIFLDEIFF